MFYHNKVQPLAHHKQNKFTTQTKHNMIQPFAQHKQKKNKNKNKKQISNTNKTHG